MATRIAHAKINLSLHVTGQREDGYHLLDSIVGFAVISDRITISRLPDHHNENRLKISGPFANTLTATSDNLVLKAAQTYAQMHKSLGKTFFPVEIHLEKNLPIASGIGGGSADAAATLLALKDVWESDIDPLAIAQTLGADVTMCLYSKPLRAQGIGDEITLLEDVPPMFTVLVNPNIHVSTPDVFTALTNKDNPPISTDVLTDMRNDLQAPAINLTPVIADVLATLEDHSPNFARMSGSGATCFGVFNTAEVAQTAQKAISAKHPDWWCVATKTLGA